MKKPTYIEGVVVALIFSVAMAGLFAALEWAVPASFLVRAIISTGAVMYVMYLFARNAERSGRVTTVTVMLIVSIVSWVTGIPALIFLLIHLGMVWLVRSLYFYSSVLSALADLGLTGLGFAAGVAAYLHSGNLILGLWSFFLVQAMFVWIPKSITRGHETDGHADKPDRFQHAQRVAEQALRNMTAQG